MAAGCQGTHAGFARQAARQRPSLLGLRWLLLHKESGHASQRNDALCVVAHWTTHHVADGKPNPISFKAINMHTHRSICQATCSIVV